MSLPPGVMPAPAPVGLIRDADMRSFMVDVIEASRTVPVLVDFWAPWCGPCKQLTPMLERLVTEAKGKVRLVKVNVDENKQLATQMRIQSLPAVYAFVDGQPVDAFMGALPESQIRQFIERLGTQGSMAEQVAAALEAAKTALAEGRPDEAEPICAEILAVEPEHAGALALLSRVFLVRGDLVQAASLLDQVPVAKAGEADVVSARAALELAQNPVEQGAVERLMAAHESAPNDPQVRFDLAVALAASDRRAEAMDHLADLVRTRRDWNDDGARKQMVKFFEAWGHKDPETLRGRRLLSTLLFA